MAESKKKRKKAAGKRAKKSIKNKKAKEEKKDKRETQEFFFKDTNASSFFALLSLEKIHHFERRLRTQRRLYEDSLRRERVEERDDVFFRRE